MNVSALLWEFMYARLSQTPIQLLTNLLRLIFYIFRLSPEFSLRPFCNVNFIVSSWSTSFTVSILHPLRCHSSSFCGTKKFKKKNNSTWWYDSNNTNDDVIPKFCFDWIFDIIYWCGPLPLKWRSHRGMMSNDLILQQLSLNYLTIYLGVVFISSSVSKSTGRRANK